MRIMLFIILFLISLPLLSQDETSAVLEIRNTNPIEPGILEFDVYMKRNSNLWKKFANGTYYFEFKKDFEDQEDYEILPENLEFVTIEDSTDLILTQGIADIEDLNEYLITTNVVPGALVVSIIGPEDYENAQEVPLNIDGNEDLRLGTFRVSATDPKESIPNKIGWKVPYVYWQSTAYKNDVERDYKKVPENEYADPTQFDALRKYYVSDNIGLENPETEILYSDDFNEPKGFVPRYVDAKYFGDGRIQVSWKTESELFLHNFVIKRMLKNFYTRQEEFANLGQYFNINDADDYEAIEPITTGSNSSPRYTNKYKVVATGTTLDRLENFDIFHWDKITPEHGDFTQIDVIDDNLQELLDSPEANFPYPELVVGEGEAGEGRGKDYNWIDPFQLEKGEWGCYHVSYQDWNGSLIPLGYDCEQVPNSVIAFANAYPNPFETECQVDFELLDDVKNLKARVIDPIGRLVTHAVGLDGTVLDNITTPGEAGGGAKASNYASRGTHTAKINIPKSELSQGSYTLIITCEPLNDRFVGSSSAIVKLQVTR